jgi:radical SAM superfamily enzyme YgiQ (UPF0313 family)
MDFSSMPRLDYNTIEKLKQYEFEIGSIRPPSEGGSYSLLLRVTRNCTWSNCSFCYALPYQHKKFEKRTLEEVKKDIDTVKKIVEELKTISWKIGKAGVIDENLAAAIIQNDSTFNYNPCFSSVFNWLLAGGKTVFLQDANTLILSTQVLEEVLMYIKETFPQVERVTSYARAASVARKTEEELKKLSKAGLSRLHIGMESGDAEILKLVNKGVTPEKLIEAGNKAKNANFEVSLYIMPGLGGKERTSQHAQNTAKVLNQIDPHFIRSRPVVPMEGTPLYEEYKKGTFELLSPYEIIKELYTFVKNLEITGKLCFDHFLNPSYRKNGGLIHLLKQDYDGYKLPEEKKLVLELLQHGFSIDESNFLSAEDMTRFKHL